MNSASMEEVDNRTFRVKFTAEGSAKLMDQIDLKLAEFLGDYTDDTLREYVLLLIGNGRQKKEVISELEVFLGDDSSSFVSWLWDHLSCNLNQYVKSQNPVQDETSRYKAVLVELEGKNKPCHPHSDKQAEPRKAWPNRKRRAHKINEAQQPSLRSSVVREIEKDRNASSISAHHTNPPASPNPQLKRKRSEVNEHENKNDHERPKPTVTATTKLIRHALRALATNRPPTSVKQPKVKRLRSGADPPVRRIEKESTASLSDTISDADYALIEAVEDDVKEKSSINVFGKLLHGVRTSESAQEVDFFRHYAAPVEYGDYYYHPQVDDHQADYYHNLQRSLQMHMEQDDYNGKYIGEKFMDEHQVNLYQNLEKNLQMHHEQRDDSRASIGNKVMQRNVTVLASANQGYDVVNVKNDTVMDFTQTGASSGRKKNQTGSSSGRKKNQIGSSSGRKKYQPGSSSRRKSDDSLMVQYNLAQKNDLVSHYAQQKEHDPSVYAARDPIKVPDISSGRKKYQPGSSSRRKVDDSLMVQYNLAQKAGRVSHFAQQKDHDPSVYAPRDPRKVLDVSVNVNSWKPPQNQPTVDPMELDTRRSLIQSEVDAAQSSVRCMKENKNTLPPINKGKVEDQRSNGKQKSTICGPGLYSGECSLEDANARTIFLNNVHFAATKGSISQHFKNIGEVLKVIILTDAATGQPRGSAYVEFMLKEAAENALSLDGTSFMSRILKVTKKSSDQQGANAGTSMACPAPRVPQTSPLAAARFSRASFPKVFTGAYGAQPPTNNGARSMQWKRDAKPSTLQNVSVLGKKNISPSAVGRGRTYIRQAKPAAKPGGA